MDENHLDQQNRNIQDQLKMQQNLAFLESLAKKKMTREAIIRYGAVKLSHPENAVKAIVIIAQAVQQGMQEMIDDDKFKQILMEVERSRKIR